MAVASTLDEPGATTVAKASGHGGQRKGAGRPARSTRDDVAVKVDRAVIARASFIARTMGQTLAEYVSETLRGPVDRDFDRASKATATSAPPNDETEASHPRPARRKGAK